MSADAFGRILPLVLGALVLVSCGGWRPPKMGSGTESGPVPDVRIHQFRTDFRSMESKRWDLTAGLANLFQRENRTELSNVHFLSYRADGKVINRVTCENGVLFNETRNLSLSNRVVLRSENGTVVSGDFFTWDNATEQFRSPVRVYVIKGNGESVSGVGFVADRRLDTVVFERDVQGWSPRGQERP